jgi:hypothetical protein
VTLQIQQHALSVEEAKVEVSNQCFFAAQASCTW